MDFSINVATGWPRARVAVRRGTLAFLVAFLALAGTAIAGSRQLGIPATFEGGTTTQFDSISVANGSFRADDSRAASGSWSGKAVYGGGGANGYARGHLKVNWSAGDTVRYAELVYLPKGFYMALQGQCVLMRADNWDVYPNDADRVGIGIYRSDHKGHLFWLNESEGISHEVGPAFTIPAGRWNRIVVEQRLGTGTSATSRVYLNGNLVVSTTGQNFPGRPMDKIRYGIVAIGAGIQTNPLTLWIDNARR